MKELEKKAALLVLIENTKQEAEKQLEELWAFAESQNYQVINAYYNGAAHVHDRTLWNLFEDAKEHKFSTLIIQDIKRLNRKKPETIFFLQMLKELGIELKSQYKSTASLSMEAEK